nr:HAD-IIIC family phosphatase [Candidatus Njordarchaeota archaeon]
MSSSGTDILQQQNELLELVRKEPTHLNYWNVYKRIKKLDFTNVDIPSQQRINIALLSSFTVDPLAICLDIDCRLNDLFPEIYIAPFNRFREEVLGPEKGLYKFKPNLIVFLVQLESLLDDSFGIQFPKMETREKQAELERIAQDIEQLLTTLSQRTSATIIFSNFVVPTFSPLGILDSKQEMGLKRFYQLINMKLEDRFRTDSQIFIFDFDQVASKYGKENYINYPMYYRGALLLSEQFLPCVSYELMGYIKALKFKNRKCIVFDLDNTLWGGIIGEDGLEKIKLNINYPGNEFVDFQRSILSLYKRGIILAVDSRNNPDDALEVFQKHPYMLIKEENLAGYRINWDDKVQNLIDLARELNIGLDSMVFVDDSPQERARVKSSLPDVLVVEMPPSPALYRKTLEDLNEFNTLSLSEEDLSRGEMYYARRKRQDLEQRAQSLEEFVKSLEIKIRIKEMDDFSLPRAVTLLNKTNQFNLTTKRYTEPEIRQLGDSIIYTLQVQDKFGDEGIVGVAIVKKTSEKSWLIDSFLMSCRVIGRKIETAFLYGIINDAKRRGIEYLEAEYIPTKKNSLAKDFYQQHNFALLKEGKDGRTSWRYPITTIMAYPQYLEVDEG